MATKTKYHTQLTIDKSRPIVFLDLCGVLNNCFSIRHDWYTSVVAERHLRNDRVDDVKASLLFSLLSTYKVQVIIVSSWVPSGLDREHERILELQTFFQYKDIIGSLYTGGGKARGDSVLSCISDLDLDNWLVIDDSHQMYTHLPLPEKQMIHPNGRYGLTDENLERITMTLEAFTTH